jgi:hypothetical protein
MTFATYFFFFVAAFFFAGAFFFAVGIRFTSDPYSLYELLPTSSG